MNRPDRTDKSVATLFFADLLTTSLTAAKLKLAGQLPLSFVGNLGKKGTKLAFLLPAEGVPLSLEAAGIITTTQRPNAAKLFVDYLFSAEAQKKLVGAYGTYSARSDVEPPAGLPKLDSFKGLLPNNWSDCAATSRDFPAYWGRVVGDEP